MEEWDLKVLDAHYNQPIGLKTTSSSGYKTSPSAGGGGLRIFDIKKIRRSWEKSAVYSAERTAVVPKVKPELRGRLAPNYVLQLNEQRKRIRE